MTIKIQNEYFGGRLKGRPAVLEPGQEIQVSLSGRISPFIGFLTELTEERVRVADHDTIDVIKKTEEVFGKRIKSESRSLTGSLITSEGILAGFFDGNTAINATWLARRRIFWNGNNASSEALNPNFRK